MHGALWFFLCYKSRQNVQNQRHKATRVINWPQLLNYGHQFIITGNIAGISYSSDNYESN